MKTILISGGDGKFSNALIKINKKYRILAPNKKQMDILSQDSISNFISKHKIDYFIHAAAFTTPMAKHQIEKKKSISTNIIGSANVALCCLKKKIKLIYISTNFVYPGKQGNYTEDSNLYPVNEYGWSKLGGECAVQMYKNSLIIRLCMTEKPFVHKNAYANVKSNFIYQEDVAHIILKVLNKKGIINVGGPSQTIYNFARKDNKKIKKIFSKGEFPKRTDMNLNKLKRIIK